MLLVAAGGPPHFQPPGRQRGGTGPPV